MTEIFKYLIIKRILLWLNPCAAYHPSPALQLRINMRGIGFGRIKMDGGALQHQAITQFGLAEDSPPLTVEVIDDGARGVEAAACGVAAFADRGEEIIDDARVGCGETERAGGEIERRVVGEVTPFVGFAVVFPAAGFEEKNARRNVGIDSRDAARADEFESPVAELLAEFLPAADFVERILIRTLDARWVLVGGDFRFGAKRGGDVALLRQMGQTLGFEVEVMPEVLSGPSTTWNAWRSPTSWIGVVCSRS